MKPKKIAKTFVCSACGLDWERHPASSGKDGPSLSDCIGLLKADLAKRSRPIYENETMVKAPTFTWNAETAKTKTAQA